MSFLFCSDSGYAIQRLALGQFGPQRDAPFASDSVLALESGLQESTTGLNHWESMENKPGKDMDYLPPTPDSIYSPQSRHTEFSTSEDPGCGAFAATFPTAFSFPASPRMNFPREPTLQSTGLNEELITSASLPLFDLFILMSRLYEAHFNLGFLFILFSVAYVFQTHLQSVLLLTK